MAVPQRFQDAPQLQQFTREDVTPTGKQLGVGSFGSVEELRVAGAICAGKKIHATLLDPGNQGWQKMLDNFSSECRLMSELRHPNLVQFLGLHFYEDSASPVLLMERLERSLHSFMEKYKSKSIPLSLKTQILFDVAKGLVYLHTRTPAVVHRDLTARNVLLSSSMQAKIADLGNARIINPGRLSSTLSRTPGTTVYMPPEATGGSPQYDTKLDMFSFGHLSLYVVAQEFPENLLPSTYTDPDSERLLPRSEIERRQPVIDNMGIHKKHTLSLIIRQCLSNIPIKRPNANTVMKQLESLVDSESNHKGMSRTELLRMIDERESLTRSKVTMIRNGQHGALQFQRPAGVLRRLSWKPYVFQINNQSHLQLLGARQTVKASVPLEDIEQVVPCPQHSQPGRAAFELKINGKPSWTLAAYTEEDMSCWMEALCLRPEPPIQDGSGASCLDEDDPYIEMTSANQGGPSQPPSLNLYEALPEDLYADPFDPDDSLEESGGYEHIGQRSTEEYEQPVVRFKPPPPHPPPVIRSPSPEPLYDDPGPPTSAPPPSSDPPPPPSVRQLVLPPCPQRPSNAKHEAKKMPRIPTDDNIAYNVLDNKPKKSPQVQRKPQPPPPPSPPPLQEVEEDTYNHLNNQNPKQVSFKRPPPNEPQKKARVYVDPSQLDMLMKMLQTTDPSLSFSDQTEATGNEITRQRSYTVPHKPSEKPPSDEEEEEEEEENVYDEAAEVDAPMVYVDAIDSDQFPESEDDVDDRPGEDVVCAPMYDDTVTSPEVPAMIPLVAPPKKDMYVNIMDADWNAELERKEQAMKKKPLVPPKPPKKPDRDAAPTLPPRPGSTRQKPKAPQNLKPPQPPPPMEPEVEKERAPIPVPQPVANGFSSGRHFTEGQRGMGRSRRRKPATQGDKIKHFAKQVRKLHSDKFLLEDTGDDDDEELYVTRPQWAKPKTVPTLSRGDDTLADLQRAALFIQRSALQNLKEIGTGQFGVVYKASLARSSKAKCNVAVKTIKRYDSKEETEEFLKEQSIMSKLVHPNIVRLYGLVEQESPWIVLELLPHGDLKTFLTNNRRHVDTLIKYMLDVAMGMHYIAEKGLVHRDLAARNIIVGENEQCKVSDFGLLRELPPGDEIYVSQNQNSKVPIRWLAPESLRNRQFSTTSDIWSFGILQWEMYFPTKLPYEELGDNMQCVLKICSENYRLSVPRDYPPMIARIMKACWHGSPGKRPSFLLISSLLTNMTFGE